MRLVEIGLQGLGELVLTREYKHLRLKVRLYPPRQSSSVMGMSGIRMEAAGGVAWRTQEGHPCRQDGQELSTSAGRRVPGYEGDDHPPPHGCWIHVQ